MFKFGTIGAFKQVRNNPRTKAVINTYNGYVVIPDDATGLAPTAATPTQAKSKDVHVVWNIIDKPEIRNSSDFYIAVGEPVRAFKLIDLVDLPVELSHDVVKDDFATVAIGAFLVPCDDTTDPTARGKWKVSTATDYGVKIKVLEKTTFGDKGFYGKVVVQ
ncbi:hypothetical protein [Paenibacillus odorifer]|uniref:hypothetical protein n=1 Tax=Paenibacillus odorifer TaxID=189426 RepID=UPI00096BF90F|nr:hypothetical protein [Paenibacillus odorifer]OMD67463.1 hypothetical protein BSK50_30265 [Paenibacillus odorifer]